MRGIPGIGRSLNPYGTIARMIPEPTFLGRFKVDVGGDGELAEPADSQSVRSERPVALRAEAG